MQRQNKNTLLTLLSLSAVGWFLTPPAYAITSAYNTSRVEILMSPEAQKSLSNKVKTEVADASLSVFRSGAVTQNVNVSLNTRGQTSLKKFPRKNLSVHIQSAQDPSAPKKMKISGLEGKQLILSSGAQDPLLVKNMISYRLFDAVSISSLQAHYTELVINQKSQGLYMVTESPDDFLVKSKNADIVVRRRYNDVMELKKADKKLSAAEINEYQNHLAETYGLLKTLKGEKLLKALQSRINLDHYMKWLAVNYALQNGDYSDEVFFYGTKDANGRISFDILPWDLDDTFQSKMHLASVPGEINVGKEERSKRQMLYSFESQLDQAISQDSVLLKRYFEVLDQVTQNLSVQKIDEVVQSVITELYPYLQDEDILKNGQLDQEKKAHNADAVVQDAMNKRSLLQYRLAEMRNEIRIIKSENVDRAEAISRIEKKMGHFILNIVSKVSQ